MTRRWLMQSVAAAVAVSWLTPALAAGQEPVPRTPWGDPDLQGIWSYATFTPLQRPVDLAGREFLTPEEVAAQNQADATRASSERRGELSRERDLALAYNQVWWDRGTSTGRTALIVDPPDGRLPPLTPQAERSQAALRDHRRDHAYDSWEDRPLQERCMTYQRVPPVPSGYSNTYHIFQTPGQVVILNEMIHDVRVVSLDGRAPIDGRIRQWNGDSRGRWDGDTLVVETTHYRDDTSRAPATCARSSGSPVSTTTPSTTGTRFSTRRPTRAPSLSRCRSPAPRATSSTSTRVTKGTTRSPTCWPVSVPWRQPRPEPGSKG